MKKAVLAVIITGLIVMAGWTVYDYVDSKNDTYGEIDGGVAISASPSDDTNKNAKHPGPEKGKQAPDFELKTLEGEPVRLSELQGEKVIVNFWATWCPPCREEIPAFQKLYDNEDIDVEILAIDVTETEKSVADVEEFVYDKFEMTFPVLMDEESDVALLYNVPAYPTTYMVDSEGMIQFYSMGAMEYEQMVQEVEKLD